MAKLRIWASALALLLTVVAGAAQESDKVTVIGSALVNDLVIELASKSGSVEVESYTQGSAAAIDRFCSGGLDLATSSRAMTETERAICGSNEVAFSEFTLAHRIVAIAAHADAPAECLTATQLGDVFKPSAANAQITWSFYSEDEAETPLTLIAPDERSVAAYILDASVAGDGLRPDMEFHSDTEAALERIANVPGALGFLTWTQDLASRDGIGLLDLDSEAGDGCVAPSAAAVEEASYALAVTLRLYANRELLDAKPAFKELLTAMLDESNQATILEARLSPPSTVIYALNADLLALDAAAVPASGDFVVPPVLSGTLKVAGAASANNLLMGLGDRLAAIHQGLSIEIELLGAFDGLERLCAAEAQIAALDRALAPSEIEACAESEFAATTLEIGAQAVVLLSQAADEHSACLTTEQIHAIWRAESADSVMLWSDVADAFPEQPLTLFAPLFVDPLSDILLQGAGDVIPPLRRDTEQDYSPLYRAAAVANVPGALTYMSWADYETVLENEQARIQLVAIDAGAGCVAPSPGSFRDGSYALARQASLVVSEAALADIATQSFLWSLYADENWPSVERDGMVALSALELPALRSELQGLFAAAEAKYPPARSSAESTDNAGAGESG